MEPWQKKFTCKNLVALQEYTDCNVQLLATLQAANILSLADIDILETVRKTNGKLAQSSLLYAIVQTRQKGYEKLANALHKCKQTGALKILIDGYREHQISNPLEQCEIPVSCSSISETIIGYLGKSCKYKEIFDSLDDKNLADILSNTECQYDYIDGFVLGLKKFELVSNTIPPPPTFYISRSISNRLEINPDLFIQKCPDIFVFKGIDRVELSRIAHPHITSTSTNQLMQLTSRFILLHYEEDWEEIRNIAKVPVHLIKYEKHSSKSSNLKTIVDFSSEYNENPDSYIEPSSDGGSSCGTNFSQGCISDTEEQDLNVFNLDVEIETFVLEETSGISAILEQFVSQEYKGNKVYLSEEEFIEKVEKSDNSHGICISDTPGMGKSWLLASLARKIQHLCRETVVVFIFLTDFINKFRKRGNYLDMSHETALNMVLLQTSSSQLSRCILFKAISQGYGHLELFFDGLDKVPPEHFEWTKKFLKALVDSRKNVKLYVTTRPHLKRELEITLGIVAYDILPFSTENQTNFLVQFWKQTIKNYDEAKLVKIAFLCLKNYSMKLNSREEKNIMGIPLQCLLLAEVHSTEARIYSNPNRKEAITIKETASLFEMYKRFVDLRLNFKSVDSSCASEKDATKISSTVQFKYFHVWKALELIFPDIAKDYFDTKSQNINLNFSLKYLSMGILVGSNSVGQNKISFVHRTFAEYFVADFFLHVLTQESICEITKDNIHNNFINEVINFIVTKIFASYQNVSARFFFNNRFYEMFTFTHPMIMYFVNAGLNLGKLLPVTQMVSDTFVKCLLLNQFYEILQCCIYHDYIHLFRFMKELFKLAAAEEKVSFTALLSQPIYKPDHDHPKNIEIEDTTTPVELLLIVAAKHSSVEMVNECIQLFQEILKLDLEKVCVRMNTNAETPLSLAVKRNSYEIVEYFINMFTLDNEELFLNYIKDSYRESSCILQTKMQIFQLLLNKIKSRLDKSSSFLKTILDGCLLQNGVHLEIIKFLVNEGANIFTSKQNKTIVHLSAGYMSPCNFRELCRYLLEDCKGLILFKSKFSTWESPLHYILKNSDSVAEDTVMVILGLPVININEIQDDEDGDNLLFSALRGNRSVRIVMELVLCGANFKFINKIGENALHLATAVGNVEVLDYLVSLGLSINEPDKLGYTPILRIKVNQVQTVKFLASKNADYTVADIWGNTVAHKAARTLPNIEFYELACLLFKTEFAAELFNTKNQNGQTPFHIFLSKESESYSDILQLLFEVPGIDINATDRDGNTYLLLVHKNIEDIKCLISAGANVLVTDTWGNTIAHRAAVWKCTDSFHDFCTLLLRKSTNKIFVMKNAIGETPLHIRLCHDNVKTSVGTLLMLLDIPGVDVNEKDEKGNTLFLSAISGGQPRAMLETLIENGADKHACNNDDENGLHLVIKNECFSDNAVDIIDYLISIGVSVKQVNNRKCSALDLANEIMHQCKMLSDNFSDKFNSLNAVIKILERATNTTPDNQVC